MLVFALCLFLSSASAKVYTDYHLLRTLPINHSQTDVIEKILDGYSDVHFIMSNHMGNRTMNFVIKKSDEAVLVSQLRVAGIDVREVDMDFQKMIDEERKLIATGADYFERSTRVRDMKLDRYHSHTEIQNIVLAAARDFPHLATAFRMGYSVEGRGILGLKIGRKTGSRTGRGKRAIYIDAGIHAREWIAPSTALYIVHRLLTTYGRDPEATKLVDELDWYIIPMVNPDGYEYTREPNGDRMWRKNRRKHRCSLWHCCIGVDLNRNFGHQWGGKGASANPCHETYRGISGFSEPESQAIRNFVMNRRDKIEAFFTLHSFSQFWLIPFGYADPARLPVNYVKMLQLAQIGAEAIHGVHGRNYTVGNSATVFYSASGASDDWARGAAGIKYAYTLELRPGGAEEDADASFVLGAHEIVPTGEEIFAGITAVAERLTERVDF